LQFISYTLIFEDFLLYVTYSTFATLPHLLFWSSVTHCSKATLIVPVPTTLISHHRYPVSNPEQSICGQRVRMVQYWPQYKGAESHTTYKLKKKRLTMAVQGASKRCLAPCPFSPRTGNASSHPFLSSSKRNYYEQHKRVFTFTCREQTT